MPLQRGKVLGYDFNRMVVDFTMFNQGKTVRCAISTAAMDDLEGKHEVKADQRVDQFLRLRDAIDRRPDNAGERCGPLRGAFPDVAQKQKQKSNEDCDI